MTFHATMSHEMLIECVRLVLCGSRRSYKPRQPQAPKQAHRPPPPPPFGLVMPASVRRMGNRLAGPYVPSNKLRQRSAA